MIRTARRAYTTFTDSFPSYSSSGFAASRQRSPEGPQTSPTHCRKYLRVPHLARQMGSGGITAAPSELTGNCIYQRELQAMRDNWINTEKMPLYLDTLRRLFQYFFVTHVDQEKGDLMIRTPVTRSRTARPAWRISTPRRYLCQWSRLARDRWLPGRSSLTGPRPPNRFVIFDLIPRT